VSEAFFETGCDDAEVETEALAKRFGFFDFIASTAPSSEPVDGGGG
jgi:hypothetical protein